MQCDEVQLEITAYLHGGLPPDHAARIEQHLSTCQACAEEAAAMRDIGKLLSRGLKDWVDEGICPPELLASIERSLHPPRRRAWYQTWPAYAGAVAAVFLLMLVAATQTLDISHQIASIPLVGGLATNLLYPSKDLHVDDLKDRVPGEPIGTTEHDGVRLEVFRPVLGADAVRIQYALHGAALDTQANVNRFEAVLEGPRGVLKLRHFQILRTKDGVLMTAEYDPVLPGQPLTLTLKNPPLETQPAQGVWQVTLHN